LLASNTTNLLVYRGGAARSAEVIRMRRPQLYSEQIGSAEKHSLITVSNHITTKTILGNALLCARQPIVSHVKSMS
jgi:hypothetical protein